MHFVQFVCAKMISRSFACVYWHPSTGIRPRPNLGRGLLIFFRGYTYMARRPRKACAHPGCPALVEAGNTYCEQHRREGYKRFDRGRGTAAQRGYGSRWGRYTRIFKRAHPLCRACEAKGIVTPTYVVDHIEPITGPDDPLFWEPSNHQPLCERCHNIKRATEDKKTWRERRERGEIDQ